jgi:hypothetical protein
MNIVNNIVDNIDERARIIYDYIYNHNQKDYNKYSISLQNINKDTIKEVSNTKFWINNILNNNITFIKKINNVYIFKRSSNNLSMNIHLYPLDENNLDNLHSQYNMNAVISYILSELSINNKTRHLLLNLLNIDIDSNDIKDFLIKFPEIDIENLLKYKKIGLSVTEHFFKIKTLDEVLKTDTFTDEKYQVLFFQILHTLAIIQKQYPEFIHNQLYPNKIYCYFKNKKNNYSFENVVFNVPDIGFDIKLYHYDKSNIYSKWDNEDLTDKEKKINKSYDWLTFINSLEIKNLPPKTKKFVNEMLNLNINNESVIPINLILSHNYFNSLKKNISNNNIMNSKIKHTDTTTVSSDNSENNEVFKGVRNIKLNKLNQENENRLKRSSKRSSKKSKDRKSSKKSSKKSRSKNRKSSKKSRSKDISSINDSLDAITINSTDKLKYKYNNNNNYKSNINKLGSVFGVDSNYLNKMSHMGMGQMGMEQMGMGQMGMEQMGMGQMPQMGMGQMPQMGMGQMGMEQMGMGQMPQMEMGQMPQMGMGQMSQMPQMGMDQMPQMGMGQMSQMGMDQMPQMGMGQMPQMGMGQMPQMGMDQMPQMGMGQMPQMEMEQMGGSKKKNFFF